MPWRRKPNSRLRYWSNGRPSDMQAEGFRTILVYCAGRRSRSPPPLLHYAEVPLDILPDWDWYDVCAHLKYTRCGSGSIHVRIGLKLLITARALVEFVLS